MTRAKGLAFGLAVVLLIVAGSAARAAGVVEKIVYSAAGAALIYYVYDPLAPNWRIEEAKLADDTYRLSLKMKRFHNGGDGEAMMVMKRRALQLRIEKGFADYQIIDYAEGIESTTPIAQRFGEGVIRLVGVAPPPSPR